MHGPLFPSRFSHVGSLRSVQCSTRAFIESDLCAGLYDGAKSDLCCPRGFVLKEIDLALLAYGVEIGAFENARDH